MVARALKTNIVISITLLLFIGMMLIDFVAVRTLQRDLIEEKISQGFLVASIFKDSFLRQLAENSHDLNSDLKSGFATILSQPGFSGIFLMDVQGRNIYAAGSNIQTNPDLEKLMKETLASGEQKVHFSGTTWGVFWKQWKDLLLSVPVRFEGQTAVNIGMVINLENIYKKQRKSQRFILLYLVVNTLVFALIGFYRLSRLYLEPINRLVSMAEDYQEEDGTFFPVRKEDNELSTLSKALNLMLTRISEDKKKLRSSVRSLEQTNIELKKAQSEIIRAEKLASIGRLSSGIAHEIGNPIGIVMGYLELLKQDDIAEDERNEYITRTENEVNRINTVIHQLLDLSRPSAHGDKHISVHDIILEISSVLQVQPLMAGIELRLSLDSKNDSVVADPDQLRQVFLNLAINAADAISASTVVENGMLSIASEMTMADIPGDGDVGEHLKITFKDNGPGIPEDCIGNIFDPFFTTKEPGKGTGLGLSVSFMIVESFKGTIKAENQADGGACLSIILPLADPVDTRSETFS